MKSLSDLSPLAERIAADLIRQRGTVAVAESAAGGLISAALLGVAGASAYFLGGVVAYTSSARRGLLGIDDTDLTRIRPASEPFVALIARRVRERHGAVWGLAESGAAGPTGNRYGDPAGHVCLAVDGPITRTVTLRTESGDRPANMCTFAFRALEIFADSIGARKS